MVEDHPLEYAKFEGKVPAGQYGAGKVTLWDYGTWEPAKQFADVSRALEQGTLEFFLNGNKLKGGFVIVKMEHSVAKNGWLLIKREDEYAVEQEYNAYDIK